MRTGCALLVCLLAGCHGGAASDVYDAGVGGGAEPDLGSPDAAPPGGDDGGESWPPLPPTPATPELWYWHHSFLSPNASDEPAASEALIDRAAAAGYHGLALWDAMLDLVGPSGFDGSKLATVIAYAHSRGLDVLAAGPPYGWSNDILRTNPNLAEGQRVVGTQFKVQGGALVPQNSLPPVQNGGFEAGQSGWFSTGDARIGVDTTVAHTGSSSAVLHAGTDGLARLRQTLTLQPWRLYHVQLWYKTQGFSGNEVDVEVLDSGGHARLYEPIHAAADGDWTAFDYTFNSRDGGDETIYIGVWGACTGTVWIDDIAVEETALVNVLRRAGTPLSIYDGTTTYAEGQDVVPIADPALAASPGNYDGWHAPPTVKLAPNSRLVEGQLVSMDYYTVVPALGQEVGACLSDPDVAAWAHDNAVAQAALFPAGTGVLLGYDELRHADSCALCRARGLTPGQLLAANVHDTMTMLRGAWTQTTRFYFWNDMFDPYHNAVDQLYFVEGDFAGSWTALPPGAIILNWNGGQRQKSLAFFAGREARQPHAFSQIIAGYYDSGDGAASAAQELGDAHGIPGLRGLMYTTYAPSYDQLEAYANAARANWPAYAASVP